MTNQDILDKVESEIQHCGIPAVVREKILDAVWEILNNELGIDLDV